MMRVLLLVCLLCSLGFVSAQDFDAPTITGLHPGEVAVIWQDFEAAYPGMAISSAIETRASAMDPFQTAVTTQDFLIHMKVEPGSTLDYRVVVRVSVDIFSELEEELVSGVTTFTASTQLLNAATAWQAPSVREVRSDSVLVEFFGVPLLPFAENSTYTVEGNTGSGFKYLATVLSRASDRYSIVLPYVEPGEPVQYRIVYDDVAVSPVVTFATSRFPTLAAVDANEETFIAVDDTYVEEMQPNRNHGLDPFMLAGRSKVYGDRLALMRFDLSTIAVNKRIVRGTLGLFVLNPVPFHVRVYMSLDGNWNEQTVTWTTRPAPLDFSLWEADGLPGKAALFEIPLDLLSDHATDVLNEWRTNPSQNFGLMVDVITLNDDFPFLQFGTQEGILPPASLTVELETTGPLPTPTPLPTTVPSPSASAGPTTSPLPTPTPLPSGSLLPPPPPTPTPTTSTSNPTPTPTPTSGGNLTPPPPPQPTAGPTPTPVPSVGPPIGTPLATPLPSTPATVVVTNEKGEVAASVNLAGSTGNTQLIAILFEPLPTVGVTFGSDVLSLTILDPELGVVQPGSDVQICFNSEGVPDKDKACLGFFDEAADKWRCEDECLKKRSNEVCGKTDHFTNFAILLTGSAASGCGAEDNGLIFDEIWQDILLVLVVVSVVVSACVCVCLVGMFVPGAQRLVYGEEGYRVHRMRSRQSTRGTGSSEDADGLL